MQDKPGFPPPLRRQLVRLDALEVGLRRRLYWEELPNGHWRVSCETAFRRDAPDRILSDLGRLPDEAGWNAAWEALCSFPESPY